MPRLLLLSGVASVALFAGAFVTVFSERWLINRILSRRSW